MSESKKTVFVVGLGPGGGQFLTVQAQSALQQAEVLCGYTVYLDLVRPLFPEKETYSTGMTKELDRCRWALETARAGRAVALVCSGDAGVYGMASPLLELAQGYPDVTVEVVPGLTAALSGGAVLGAHLGTALNGNRHGKTARITGGFGFFLQGLRDHLPGDMIDGGFAHRLVEAGLRHPAHPLAAVDAHLSGQLRPEGHTGNDRQAGGHVHIVAAVFADGALCPLARPAAEDRLYLHHDALRGAEGHRLRGTASEEETGCARRPQRRAGAGGVAAAQELLTAADIVLKAGLPRLGGLFRFTVQKSVLLVAQIINFTDVFPGKRLSGRHNVRDARRRDADDLIRDLLGQL